MILDTKFVIDIINGKGDAISKLNSFAKDGINYSTTTVTIFELWSGLVILNKNESHKNKILLFLKDQIIKNLDSESAQFAGKIYGHLIKKGLEIDAEDCMIAGIAIKNNEKLATNDNNFDRIEGLRIEKY